MMFAYGLFFGSHDWLMIPGLLFGLYAQFKLSGTYGRYHRQAAESGLSGAQAAREILDGAGLYDVPVKAVDGHLSDHYDPVKKELCLSQENYHGRSVAALGVAAHEAGHALQHQQAYAPLQMRMMLAPVTGFASGACWLILLGGYILAMLRIISIGLYAKLLPIAIVLFLVVTFFQLITLPVEYDASRRAREMLIRMGLVRGRETHAVGQVLNAAALTYVAALVASVFELLRLILVARGLDDRS